MALQTRSHTARCTRGVGRAAGVSRSPHRNSLAPRRGPQASWGSPAPARCQRQRPPAPATAASAAAAAALSASPAPRLVESTASRLFEKVADPPPPLKSVPTPRFFVLRVD
jgi:hypothetical protein